MTSGYGSWPQLFQHSAIVILDLRSTFSAAAPTWSSALASQSVAGYRRLTDQGPLQSSARQGPLTRVTVYEVRGSTPSLPAMSSNSTETLPTYPGLSFITFSDPTQSRLPGQRKAVRSHAASYQYQLDKATAAKLALPKRKRVRKRGSHAPIVLELKSATHLSQGDGLAVSRTPSPFSILGGGRIDPFRTYPVPWEPFIPGLVDHYVVHMATDMPELDEPDQPGLLRKRWFPLVMSEAATFQVIVLLSASNYASLRYPHGDGPDLLLLKSRAISSINKALKAADSPTNDELIGAVAKMASYEAMFGDMPTYEMHMGGLVKMVQLRGGLEALGLGGLLARICVWIDRNSAFLNRSPIHFASVSDELSAQVNPGGFLAAS